MNNGEQEVWVNECGNCRTDCYSYRSVGKGKQGQERIVGQDLEREWHMTGPLRSCMTQKKSVHIRKTCRD